MGETTGDGESLGRRDLIKKAAAAGTIAWTAPVISGSLASPAAAATLPSLCFKYQHNWAPYNAVSLVTALNSKTDNDQVWDGACFESDTSTPRFAGAVKTGDPAFTCAKGFNSHQLSPSGNCCLPKDANENVIQWEVGNPGPNGSCIEAIRTFPNPECIIVSPPCPGDNPGYSNGDSIVFTIDRTQCPGCYFADGQIVFTQGPPDVSNGGANMSFGNSQFGDSDWFNGVRFQFNNPGGNSAIYPIYFKFWIACNLNWNIGQNVPDTQCDLPVGEPGANPGHTKGDADGNLVKIFT